MKKELIDEIKNIPGISVSRDYKVTSFINVDAIFKYKIDVLKIDSLNRLFKVLKRNKIRYCILGKCSNVLFKKSYYNMALINIVCKCNNESEFSSFEDVMKLNNKLINKGISTLLFLTMVPCSLGGAIYMNAGANGKEMKDVIEYVYFYDIRKKKVRVFDTKECKFKYRDSYFRHHKTIILAAKLKIEYLNQSELIDEYKKIVMKRSEVISLKAASLGCIFKNFSDISAGKLIDDLGLKGMIYNGIKISEKHANVIVNCNNCDSRNIINLINIIKNEVYLKTKRKLQLEIISFE